MNLNRFTVFFILALLVILSACNNEATTLNDQKETNDDQKLSIYTTVYPLQYFTQEIGGQYVNVKSIYPAGGDAHTFEPTQKEMIHLADADLFFYIGLGLESFAEKAEQSLKNENVSLVATGEQISLSSSDKEVTKQASDIDPHVWLDPVYSQQLAVIIKEKLSEHLPEHESYLTNNLKKLVAHLNELDGKFKQLSEDAKQHKILVSHAAFGYWENRYDIEQISISGLSTTNEPTQKQLEKIISTVKDNNLKYIMFEQNGSSRLANIIQRETNTEPVIIHNLSVLTEDDLKDKEDYFSLMNSNLKVLDKALNKN